LNDQKTNNKVDYALLRTLHIRLQQLTDISDRMRRGPIQIRLAKTNEAAFSDALDAKKIELAEVRKDSRAKQSQLDDREAKVEDMRAKLNAAESNKEFQLLKDRIAADEQANSCQADEIFETLEKLDVLESELKAATENLEKAKQETNAISQKVAAEMKTLEGEEASVREKLAHELKDLHPDLVAPYKRSIQTKGEDTFAATDATTCGNCNLTLTQQTASDLLMCKPLLCKGCGAILYRDV
jgi:predicted  nucleic acid-binding Zn-ribbon protein